MMHDAYNGVQSTYAAPTTDKSFNDIVRHFTPAWFTVNMGTGAISLLFHAFPYGGNTKIMNIISLMFFFLNLVLFIVFLLLSLLRYILFPPIWGITLRHPVQSLFLGCSLMGAATLVSAGVSVVHEYWGFGGVPFLYVLWAFWWLDSILSFLCCFGLVHIMSTRHHHSMSTLTPVWLLPVVTIIVASSAGQTLAAQLKIHSLPHAFLTIGVSVVMTAIGISLALMIMTLYLRRLLTEGLPEVSSIISSFMPLGPCGQAGYSLLIAGQNFEDTLPWGRGSGSVMADPLAGKVLHSICLFSAFMLWCLGVWWFISAIIAIADTMAREKIPFKLSFWGLVFPNGVQALLTIQLGKTLDANLFRILGAIHGAAVLLIWLVLAVPTFIQVLDKSIFNAPGLEDDLMRLANPNRDCNVETPKTRTQS